MSVLLSSFLNYFLLLQCDNVSVTCGDLLDCKNVTRTKILYVCFHDCSIKVYWSTSAPPRS